MFVRNRFRQLSMIIDNPGLGRVGTDGAFELLRPGATGSPADNFLSRLRRLRMDADVKSAAVSDRLAHIDSRRPAALEREHDLRSRGQVGGVGKESLVQASGGRLFEIIGKLA